MSHSPSKHSFLLSSFSWAFARLKRALTYLGLSSTAFVQSCATSVHFCCGQKNNTVREAPLSSLRWLPTANSRVTRTQRGCGSRGSGSPCLPLLLQVPQGETAWAPLQTTCTRKGPEQKRNSYRNIKPDSVQIPWENITS